MKSIFIIGPSGSGKSTLSKYLAEVYKALFGTDQVLLINLDPASTLSQQNLNQNTNKQNHYDININDLVSIEDVMQEYEIGPNGAMVYAMQFLYENKQWLTNKIHQEILKKQPHVKLMKQLAKKNQQKSKQTEDNPDHISPFTLIFDLPGQIQLYLQNPSLKQLILHIQQQVTPRSCILQLFDSTYIYQVNDFVSLCMMSLVTMINLSMPHFNVLNKIDVIKGQRPPLGVLNDYFDICSVKGVVDDLSLDVNDDPQSSKILQALSSILDQYNQVSFIPCSVYKISLIKYLVVQIELTFNNHQIHKLNNSKYMQFVQEVEKPMAKQQIITQLQNQLFREEQQEIEQQKQQIQKVLNQIQSDINKATAGMKKNTKRV